MTSAAESNSTPSVTLCITELDVGGAEKAFVRIAIGLKERGWSVRVISLRNAGVLSEELRRANIETVALGCGGLADVRIFWRLRSQLKRFPTDALLCFLYQANFYGRLAGRAAGIKKIVSGVRVADRRRVVVASDRLTSCCTDHYVAVSRHVATVHSELCRIDPARITTIPNGVDVDIATTTNQESRQSEETRHIILFAGRLTKQKNPLLLLKALEQLPIELRNASELWVAGEGPLRPQLERQIQTRQICRRVKLLGHRSDVVSLMRQATVLVLPSKWEGLPNVVMEAMAVGLPVITTAVDGTPELITDGDTGWLVPSDDAAALSSAMEQALTSPKERQQRAAKAQTVALQRFNWGDCVAAYDVLLRSLLPR